MGGPTRVDYRKVTSLAGTATLVGASLSLTEDLGPDACTTSRGGGGQKEKAGTFVGSGSS